MLELGEFSEALHMRLAQPLEAAGIDRLYAAGPMMQRLFDVVDPARRARYAAKSDDLVKDLLADLRPGDSVVIKGSLGSKMGPVVEALRKAFPAAKKEA
jgi:UDP-N-acetylmuramyl pentapeptide synthase